MYDERSGSAAQEGQFEKAEVGFSLDSSTAKAMVSEEDIRVG